MVALLGSGLLVSLVGLTASLAGVAGIAYLLLWAVCASAGLPVGFRLFGRAHAAGWVAGLLFGQLLTAFIVWAAIETEFITAMGMAASWIGGVGVLWLLARRRANTLVVLPGWSRRDSAGLLAFLWLVPVLVGPAFLGVGRVDADGSQLYRAYFTADFLWHTALTNELARLALPLTNPYLASEPLHYYWAFFLLPAAAVAHGHWIGLTTQYALLVHATCSGLLFFAVFFVATWAAVPRLWPALAAVTLSVTASSLEGSLALWRQVRSGLPISGVRELNVDALTAWLYNGLRVDGLPRSLWYVPQHAAATAFGLVALIVVGAAGPGTSTRAIWLAGTALGGATAFSPFIGASFSLVYGVAALLDSIGSRSLRIGFKLLLRHACAAIPVFVALWWISVNRVLDGTAGSVVFGVKGLAHNHPFITLGLGLGPLMLTGVLGLISGRWTRRMLPGVAGLAVGLGVMYLVSMPLDRAYVGFRAGQVLLLTVPMLSARYFALGAAGGWRRGLVLATGIVIFVAGAPTAVIDAYNAQDTGNREMAAGFHWTIAVSPAQQAALDWLRATTPPTAVVQMDPNVRGRETWTFIPSFAGRRMAAGRPISLLNKPTYAAKSDLVHEMYATETPQRACQIARELGIDDVYLDETERSAVNVRAVEKFAKMPDCFRPVYHSRGVDIVAVVPVTVLRR